MAPRPAHSSATTDSAQGEAALPAAAAGFRFSPSLKGAVEKCWSKAAVPPEWNLTAGEFQAALERSAAHRYGGAEPPPESAIEAYLETLNVGEIALARACSAGNAAAWDFFVAQFRPELYRAARAITGNAGESAARELADSLYADLYGLREREGQRKSLFDYFQGRSKLGTWLRAILAQRQVNEIRRRRRVEPLENESGEQRGEITALASSTPASPTPDPERTKYLAVLQATLTDVLDALDARDRLRLTYYYADDRTLAEIGRLLGEHEATVSRKLKRTRRNVRQLVEAALRDEKNWSDAQIQHCLEYARGEWPFDLTASLRSAGGPSGIGSQASALAARD